MNRDRHPHLLRRTGFVLLAALAVLTVAIAAQDRLKSMPGYDQYPEDEQGGRPAPSSRAPWR